jgi:large subunit ribosomal protein L13
MKKINRKIHKIDVTNQPLGRVATQTATLLRGKHKPEFEPHMDCGDFVEISNIDKIKFSGKKLEQKKYYHYSGYPGGLKETSLEDLFKKNPAAVLKKAVRGMLPNNRLRKNMLKRLKIV